MRPRSFYRKRGYPILRRSMLEELPKYLDTRYLAELIGALSGVISSDRLQRIDPLYSAARPVMVRLNIVQEETGIRLGGKINTELTTTCQRCLNNMEISIDKKLDMLLVESTAMQSAPGIQEDEVLIIDQEKIDIEQLIEDELILSCPMITLHETILCPGLKTTQGGEGIGLKKPFADLANLIRQGKNEPRD